MGLNEFQRREVVQLILVAREYLLLAKPPKESESLNLSHAIPAFTKATLSSSEWSQTMTGAHLASSAVRLASADELLEKTRTGSRHVYTECRAYFRKWSKSPQNIRGSTCSEWFHIMLRDAIGHREGDTTEDIEQTNRYDQRQRCIEQTSFLAAHARLQRTVDELVTVLVAVGIPLPGLLLPRGLEWPAGWYRIPSLASHRAV